MRAIPFARLTSLNYTWLGKWLPASKGFKALAALAVLTSSGCVTARKTESEPAFAKLSVGCNINVKDPYGKWIGPDYCWVQSPVNSALAFPNALPMTASTFIVVDDNGPRLLKQEKRSSLCDRVPVRVAVDGQRIDILPMQEQISRVVAGETLVREEARPWPYCNLINVATRLDGAAAAIDEAKALWDSRRGERAASTKHR